MRHQLHRTLQRSLSGSSKSRPVSANISGQAHNSPPKLTFIPAKTKEEIIALHISDPTRWTATTLSSRFGAASANVSALLRLARIRQKRETDRAWRSEEDKQKLADLSRNAVWAWSQLAEVVQGGRRAPVARPSAKVAAVSDHASGEVSVSEEEGKDDVEESDVKEQVVVKSAWAQELEQDVGHAERDVTRRTTFAFVEIGVEKHVSGAVWVREGETGVLRLAQEEERRLLLGEVRARDTEAWK